MNHGLQRALLKIMAPMLNVFTDNASNAQGEVKVGCSTRHVRWLSV